MRRVLYGLLLLVWLSTPAHAQLWVTSGGGGVEPWLSNVYLIAIDSSYAVRIANSGATPTLVACGSGGTAIDCAAGSTADVLGITSEVGDGVASVAIAGLTTCTFDTATTTGNYVQLSDTTAGNCSDVGAVYPTNGKRVLGVATGTAGSPTIVGINLFARGVQAPRVATQALASDATANATTTGAKITGLSKTTGTGTFTFKYSVRYQAAATTTGVAFGINHTGTTSGFVATAMFQAAAGTPTIASQAVAGPVTLSGMSTRTLSTTAPNLGPTTGVGAANADLLLVIEGLITVTAAGDLELWHASEVAASSQIMAGTSLVLTRTQ